MTEPDPGGKDPGPEEVWEGANPDLKHLRKKRTRRLPGKMTLMNRIFQEDPEEVLEEVPEEEWEEADTGGVVAVAGDGTAVPMIPV